ncbi:helix-turn-helix domain-containing protein [Streptomyces bottropensis]|uniref:helix-turn-helix domain-containing protein n=1 Tax=Streptomyces bottropensis TaxID=42235 RepID=UPI0038012B64
MNAEERRPRPAIPYGSAGRMVAENVRRIRGQRGMTTYTLSDALAEAGRPITPTAIVRLEKQKRQVTVDDLAALAAALSVTPAQLLEPPTDCRVCHGTPPPGFACTECGTTTKEDRPQSSTAEGDGICTATLKDLEDQVIRCAQPAGHYNGDNQPDPLTDDSPGGWHRSAPGRDRVTWSDWATGTTPHKETP